MGLSEVYLLDPRTLSSHGYPVSLTSILIFNALWACRLSAHGTATLTDMRAQNVP